MTNGIILNVARMTGWYTPQRSPSFMYSKLYVMLAFPTMYDTGCFSLLFQLCQSSSHHNLITHLMLVFGIDQT